MLRLFCILILGIVLANRVSAQCDKTTRDQILFASLNYFQDSINSNKPQILLLDSTRFSHDPSFVFEPDLFKAIPDTLVILDLSTGLKKNITLSASQIGLKSCPRIRLTSSNIISQALNNNSDWKNFYRVDSNALGYYSTTEPVVVNNYALIYIENFCGNLCGSGYVIYLNYNKNLKKWVVTYSIQSWVS